jgi:hypothetical protein
MTGPVRRFLEQDHTRLDALLQRSVASPGGVDLEAFEAFRAGLLRHIAIEEKILLPTARRLLGAPLAVAARLRADHSALASLLVPTPTREIITTIQGILEQHNPLEEGEHGMYARCEQLFASELDAILARVHATPEVPLAAHFDGPRVHEHIANLLRARASRG